MTDKFTLAEIDKIVSKASENVVACEGCRIGFYVMEGAENTPCPVCDLIKNPPLCKCRKYDERFAVVDPKCLLEMHRKKPAPFYGDESDRVPPGMMFDLGIYLADEKSVTFECGCYGDLYRDGWEWAPWIDCVVAYHPELFV